MKQFIRLFIVSAETANTFKRRLDKFWSDQDVLYNYIADLHGIGNRSTRYYSVVFYVLIVLLFSHYFSDTEAFEEACFRFLRVMWCENSRLLWVLHLPLQFPGP